MQLTDREVTLLDAFEIGVEEGFAKGRADATVLFAPPFNVAYSRGHDLGVMLAKQPITKERK